MLDLLKEFQAHNCEKVNKMIKDEVEYTQEVDIVKTVCAMIELDVSEEIIKEKLIKYWDLRPSETDYFIQEAKEVIKCNR